MRQSNYVQCSGEAWDKARMRALVRDDFTCQFHALRLKPIDGGCTHARPETRLRNLQVHHKVYRINGGTHDLDNLVTVCRSHHAHIHPHMNLELAEVEFDAGGFYIEL